MSWQSGLRYCPLRGYITICVFPKVELRVVPDVQPVVDEVVVDGFVLVLDHLVAHETLMKPSEKNHICSLCLFGYQILSPFLFQRKSVKNFLFT